jgi:excisionase family DNA binding protein
MEWSEAQMDRPATAPRLPRHRRVVRRLHSSSPADSTAPLCLQFDSRKKMIMTLQAGDKLMSVTDVSEMLGIPVHTLYRWRCMGDGPVGYRVGRHVRYRREAVEAWLEQRADQR